MSESVAPPVGFPAPTGALQLPSGVVVASVGRRVGAYFLSGVLAIVTLGIGYLIWGAIVWARAPAPPCRSSACAR